MLKNILFLFLWPWKGDVVDILLLPLQIHALLNSALLSASGAELYGLHQGASLPLFWLNLANRRHWQENRGQDEKERG